jgi:hypothetical protein
MGSFDAQTLDDVDAYVAENGVDALHKLMEPGRLRPERRMLVAAWIDRQDRVVQRAHAAEEREAARQTREAQEAHAAEERALLRRSTGAAEQSARAAEASAKHAAASVRWAALAALIALGALFFSAWPYMRIGFG